MDNRIYARGFFVSDERPVEFEEWEVIEVQLEQKKLFFCYDTRNNCYYGQRGDYWLILLGTAMDTEEYVMELERIATKALEMLNDSRESFLDYLDCLCGRHIILYGTSDGAQISLLQDATGMRSVYYHTESLLIASHAKMIQDIINNPKQECWELFCEIREPRKMVPGRITPYKDIVCLTPNHELDLKTMVMKRFWPRKKKTREDIDTVMDYVANNFKRQAETINKYYNKLCMSLTAGMDSKTTLAAFKEQTSNITFFTYYDPTESMSGTDTKMDTEFVESFTAAHHLNYKRLSLPLQADKTISEICKKNVFRSHLTKAVELYANEFGESYLHIRSNILELIRGRKMYTPKSIPENTPECFLKYRYRNIDIEILN